MEHIDNEKVILTELLGWVRHGIEYETAILSGDPEQPGSLYASRYRTLISRDVPAHWHPEDEHVTVVGGVFFLGFGERFSTQALRKLAPGSYALIPSQQRHFARYTPETIIQVHGVGPLTINYVEK